MSASTPPEKIMVIKLGALGDFVQALGPMAAIRKHHPHALITLLTTKPFEKFGLACGYFDTVYIDTRPRLTDLRSLLAFRHYLLHAKFDRIYDLQNNDRTALYFRLFPKKQRPEWVGTLKKGSHYNGNPDRCAGLAFYGDVQTLALAGINNVEIDSMDWVTDSIAEFSLKKPYILIVAGCAPQHPHKRWPAQNYSKLVGFLKEKGFQCVLIGTQNEAEVTQSILKSKPDCLDLTGQTNLFQIAALAKNAAGAIGNDTGPMHIIGVTNCPSLVLFSGRSNPIKHAPLGNAVHTLQKNDIKDISVNAVEKKLNTMLKF